VRALATALVGVCSLSSESSSMMSSDSPESTRRAVCLSWIARPGMASFLSARLEAGRGVLPKAAVASAKAFAAGESVGASLSKLRD